jgi:hypothetical protein
MERPYLLFVEFEHEPILSIKLLFKLTEWKLS